VKEKPKAKKREKETARKKRKKKIKLQQRKNPKNRSPKRRANNISHRIIVSQIFNAFINLHRGGLGYELYSRYTKTGKTFLPADLLLQTGMAWSHISKIFRTAKLKTSRRIWKNGCET